MDDHCQKAARELGLRKPALRGQITGLYLMMQAEIDAGESATHEAELFISSLEELDKENP